MTPSEQKIYDLLLEIKEDNGRYDTTLKQHFEAMVNIGKIQEDEKGRVDSLVADRNKVIGFSWLGSAVMAIGAAIYELIKHK